MGYYRPSAYWYPFQLQDTDFKGILLDFGALFQICVFFRSKVNIYNR